MKEFTKWIPKPWMRSSEKTIELIIDQSWGAQLFPWQSPIMKFLNSLGMVYPPYTILEYPYAFLTLCDMR